MSRKPAADAIPDVLALTEAEKYELEIYHRYDDAANRRKLDGLYGRLVAAQDRAIRACVAGRSVLDVGCGYGLTSRHLRNDGFEVTSIDPCAPMRGYAREWHGIEALPDDIHATSFPDRSFDTVIVRESVEHLVCEAAFREMDRVGRGVIVVFQTNLSLPVRVARALLGHQEFNPRTLEYYRTLLSGLGYRRQQVVFRDVFALPISGGMVSAQLCPHHRRLERAIVAADEVAGGLLRGLGLARWLCWRFVLRAARD